MLGVPGHTVMRKSKVVGGSDYPDRTYYRDTITCETCGWVADDFGDELRLHVEHLTHAFSSVLVEKKEKT